MTITFNNKPVIFKQGDWKKEIKLGGEEPLFLDEKLGTGRELKAILVPGIITSKQDSVSFTFRDEDGFSGTNALRGSEIKKNALCKRFGIGWYK